jgi:hypothetical protein
MKKKVAAILAASVLTVVLVLLFLGAQIEPRWGGVSPGILPEVIRWCGDNMEVVLAAAHDLGYGDDIDIGTYGGEYTRSCGEAFRASGLDINQLPRPS